MKTCQDCLTSKPENEFHVKRYKSGKVGLRSYCKDCSHKQREEWRKTNPLDNERNKVYNKTHALEIRGKKLVKQYWPQLTWEQAIEMWNLLLKEQNGACGICKKEKKSLHVDHNHTTGKVRGLLCYNCNNGLGRFKDSIEFLYNAVKYLTKDRP